MTAPAKGARVRLDEDAERAATIATLAAAFSRVPARLRAHCGQPVTGSPLFDMLVSVEAPDGSGGFKGGVPRVRPTASPRACPRTTILGTGSGERHGAGADPASPGCLQRIASRWALDGELVIFSTDGAPSGELILCQGYDCHVEVQ